MLTGHASGISLGHASYVAVLEEPDVIRRELDAAVQLMRTRTAPEDKANADSVLELLKRFPLEKKARE